MKEKKEKYQLRLFITGNTPNSVKAIVNLKRICDVHLDGNFDLEIIDIYQQPELAQPEQLLGAPLLIIKYPLPERRLIGDLSNTAKILKALNL